MAIHGALSRLCYAYRATAPRETYFQYGWRNMEGVPFLRNVPLEKKPSIKFHMSELECHIVSVEDALAKEMKTHDKTKEDYKTMWKIALGKEDRIEIMEETILAMGDTVDELTAVQKNLEAQLEQK